MTNEQQVVVETFIKRGYKIIGNFINISGLAGCDVALYKGKHRVHINVLGYDSYISGLNYQEVK